MTNVEEKVRSFYDTIGWADSVKGEARFFRQLSGPYYPYHRRVDQRICAAFAWVYCRSMGVRWAND